LQSQHLQSSPPADKATLIRRVTLDLTGLPPTLEEVDAFLKDESPDAYERVVDRLLASPHYGERMALDWLDVARYADTHGYHIDAGRDMTRWREWVIDAFNANKPFDQFTVEQLAGDLLPNATVDQKVASGFNRNHMINFEGGAVPEEYHTAYLVDRVNTTGTVWLGLTVACAQCHDHKYDPIKQREYYQLYAFFNNLPEKGLDGNKGNAAPAIKTPTAAQQQQLDALAAGAAPLRPSLADPALRPLAVILQNLQTQLDASVRTTMVMQEMPTPRETHVLLRGQYDKPGDVVTPNIPTLNGALPPLGTQDSAGLSPSKAALRTPNRLDLARWIVSKDNPLTARVIVNRYWQAYFGTGIVKTAEDVGTQGEWPTHPELLDYLASRFIASGWDVKAMQRLIVTSATYRQSSRATPDLIAKDPENRLLARGPRVRLPAEFIRDQALAISGLLNPEIGGASVSPYQPAGLWEELMSRSDGANWTAQTYTQSHGKDLYRRTMYTFWKRTSPPPTLSTFDAPDREVCTVRRSRTNTPLQALVLMNDPTYLEASRKLAERLLTGNTDTADQRLTTAFRLATARTPGTAELDLLRRALDQHRAKYRAHPDLAQKLLKIGESPVNEKLDAPELAAWTLVSSVLLNLDETVTKN
jgi:hypothetical protein